MKQFVCVMAFGARFRAWGLWFLLHIAERMCEVFFWGYQQ